MPAVIATTMTTVMVTAATTTMAFVPKGVLVVNMDHILEQLDLPT